MVATLHIHLLGNFSLVYNDQPITGVNTTRLQALLAYLVIHRQAPQSRPHLAFLFWPDTSEAQALSNLRNLLHKLRHALPEPQYFIQADAQTVQWCLDAPYTFDVADLETAFAEATARADLEMAVKLYSGDLLPSCYDDWIVPVRERLRQRTVDALTRLIDLLAAEGVYHTAIGYSQQLLHFEPANEPLYGKLMGLYAAVGDRAGLLRAYHTCVEKLAEELGIEPTPATYALYQQLVGTLVIAPAPAYASVARSTNLPLPLNSFVGRRREMAAVKALLMPTSAPSPIVNRQPQAFRLVTLTGAGGSGKTRLALHTATDLVDMYKDGIWWVELGSLSDSSLVPQAVAKMLGISEVSTEAWSETLNRFLNDKQLLLVLDNCEHLVDACARLAYMLLSCCPQLQILATSREPLGITGEQVYPVPTLSLPKASVHAWPELIHESEAFHLFVERVQAVDAHFRLTEENVPPILQICHRLDGIPLAIELAAASARVLSVAQIAMYLSDCLNLLTNGSRTAPARHHTLRATLDWSYALLTDDECILLRRLSIFVGHFPLEAVVAVCGSLHTAVLDVLAHLVDKSLVIVDQASDHVQYRLLEPIHDYAREKLVVAGEEALMRVNHLNFYIHWAEAVQTQLHGAEQELWLARLERSHDNVRDALSWALAQNKRTEALRLSGAMGLFWQIQGYWREGRSWLTQALALRDKTDSPVLAAPATHGWFALALWRVGTLLWLQCNFEEARIHLEESLALYRALADWESFADVLGCLGAVTFEQGDYKATQTFYEESLAVGRRLSNLHRIGISLFGLGLVAYHLTDYTLAQTRLTESMELLRTAGHKRDTTYALNALGNIANVQGDYQTAREFYQKCLALRRELGYKRGVAATLNDLANVTAKQGDYATAQTLYTESLLLFRDLGNQRGMAWALAGLARLRQAQGHPQLAATLLGAVAARLKAMNAQLDEPEYSDSEQAIIGLRTQLDISSFNCAWAEGQRLTLEQAIILAH